MVRGVLIVILLLSKSASADVLPCRAEPARAFDSCAAPVRYAAQTGRVLIGAVGIPIGVALTVITVPLGAATGPLWIHGDHAVAEGAVWGICPGLLTIGAFADLGYYVVGGPAYGVSLAIGATDADSHDALEPVPNPPGSR